MIKQRIVFASANRHKLEEISKVIDHNRFEIINLTDLGITEDIVEDGDTLEANALIKARYVHSKHHCNVFSEDTGLEVTALGMDPGIYTARYAGPQKNASDNMDLLIQNLEGSADRSAQFRACIALIWEGKEVLFEGIVEGSIAKERTGKEGFGYDPIFVPKGYSKSFADLPDSIKLSMSHRTRALKKMIDFLDSVDL